MNPYPFASLNHFTLPRMGRPWEAVMERILRPGGRGCQERRNKQDPTPGASTRLSSSDPDHRSSAPAASPLTIAGSQPDPAMSKAPTVAPQAAIVPAQLLRTPPPHREPTSAAAGSAIAPARIPP